MKIRKVEVAGLVAHPGERVAQRVAVSVVGVAVEIPLFVINGAYEGPTMVVTAGIHGGEYPCVEAALRLGRTLDPATLHGQMIVAPIANPLAFAARSIYVTPPDGKNLNRQFPGKAQGTFTEAWAYWLFQEIIRQGDVYIDLHGGDMIEALVPFVTYIATGDDAVDAVSRAMGRSFGIGYVMETRQEQGSGPSGTTRSAAALVGIPALLAEAGGQGVWNEENVGLLYTGVQRVMAYLEMTAPVAAPGASPVMLDGWEWLRAAHDGLFYPRVQVGQRVTAGQDVGRIADVFGATLQAAHAPVDGVVLFLVTSLAINTGDPLLAIAY